MERISKHISYKEAIHSNTAIRKGINNEPDGDQLAAMKLVAEKVFEPVRVHYNVPIRINSFLRVSALNVAVGGSKSSQHCKGEAIDMDSLRVTEVTNKDIFNYIKDNLDFDQLIWEYGTDKEPDWVHVSYSANGNRKQVLKAVRGKGYVLYND
jgi:hypothetical protein